ncbi:putative porin [Cytophagaceae bacterium YF14B1]|uniref:Porin n=1 Tax=Xanthocytophaga flava TaxID=3048013 RepID=A0AAE3U6L5_9BACT|nr:putative porin [Xanthocytophaga flavus]MDJ1481471.1 putative porin [Xanthocytophaga flavus]
MNSLQALSRLLYKLVLLLFIGYVAQAQVPGGKGGPLSGSKDRKSRTGSSILDDSTKQVYGPETSRFLLENDLLTNRDTTYAIDTLLENIHNYNFVNRYNNRYVDLGNLGTAIRPVFYTPPAQIGTYFGMNVYDLYALTPDKIKYYDTKSPYTYLKYVQGGLYQQLLNLGHSRNINSRWNIGFDFQRLTSGKQYGYTERSERQVDHYGVSAYTRWISSDSAYHILAHFSHQNHWVNEQGGILNTLGTDQSTLLDNFAENAVSQLVPAISGNPPTQMVRGNDYRNNWHIYHQYKFGNGFQVYHIFDRQTQRYDYYDNDNTYSEYASVRGAGNYFYPDVSPSDTAYRYYFSDDTTHDVMRYIVYENRIGLKGKYQGWDYRLYARRRDFKATYTGLYTTTNTEYNPVTYKKGETFLGAWGQYSFKKNIKLYAEAEFLLFRDYKLSGTFESPWFKVSYLSMLYSPTVVQQRMYSNHFRWSNDFSPVSVNQLSGQLTLKYKALTFEPSASISNLANYIYLDQDIKPQQSSAFQIFNVGVSLNLHGKIFHTENQVVFTQTTNNVNVIRMPQWFINSRWYAEGFLFRKALFMQIGIDAHYKSDYYANAYMPAIAQFYLQDEFLVKGYPVIDVFANARVGRVRLFVKMSHINQGLVFGNGYFTTPYYPGQRRTLGFGVLWPLFD